MKENLSLAHSLDSPDTSQANAELLAEFHASLARADVAATPAFIAPDFVLHVPGRGQNAGEYWGVDGFRTFLSNVLGYAGGVFGVTVPVLSVTGSDAFSRKVLQLNRARDREHIWTLQIANRFKLRSGQLSEWWIIPEDQRAYDAYWTPSSKPPPATIAATSPAVRGPLVIHVERATSPENFQLLSAMYDLFWRGDKDAMRQTIAGDVVVNITGQSGLSGVYRGWSGYMLFRERLMAMIGRRYKLDVTAMAASTRDAWALEHIRMDRRWDPEVRSVEVLMHFAIENGKITQMDDLPVDPDRWNDFYTAPSVLRDDSASG